MGKKDKRVPEISTLKGKGKAAGKEEPEETPKIKGCHVSIDVCGGCIRQSMPVPVANASEGVKLACTNHNCPFAHTRSVHRDCFKKLTEKVVSMLLRTGSSSWTDEQRVENAWRKKGLTFVGKYISCPCGHGTQTLEDSENRWSRLGEVVLDADYGKQREEKIKKALTKDKPSPTMPKTLNCSFGGKGQAELAKKLERMEWEKENQYAASSTPSRGVFSSSTGLSSTSGAARKTRATSSTPLPAYGAPTVPAIDDDGFTSVGKDGRAREVTACGGFQASSLLPATPEVRKGSKGSSGLRSLLDATTPSPLLPSPLANMQPQPPQREARGRTVSTSSTTSWLTCSSLPTTAARKRDKELKKEAKAAAKSKRGGNKENISRGGSGSAAAGDYHRTGGAAGRNAYSVLSGSEDEEVVESRPETPALQSATRNLREFADDFHQYSGVGYWSASEVREFNQHLSLFKSDSAEFSCRVSGRKLKEPTILTQLTPVTAWTFVTLAMAVQKPDIPPGTQLTLQELYALYHDYEVKHLEDPIIWCRDGTQVPLECADMTMLTMGK